MVPNARRGNEMSVGLRVAPSKSLQSRAESLMDAAAAKARVSVARQKNARSESEDSTRALSGSPLAGAF